MEEVHGLPGNFSANRAVAEYFKQKVKLRALSSRHGEHDTDRPLGVSCVQGLCTNKLQLAEFMSEHANLLRIRFWVDYDCEVMCRAHLVEVIWQIYWKHASISQRNNLAVKATEHKLHNVFELGSVCCSDYESCGLFIKHESNTFYRNLSIKPFTMQSFMLEWFY